MGQRPSADVDLFTDWHLRADFPTAVEHIIRALQEAGFEVTVALRRDTFARLLLSDGSGAEPEKLELSADWRAHPPVKVDVGPVLHPDDAVANKMTALFGRAEARDFLDIDAAIVSGRYSRERLIELAANADAGFDQAMFAEALGSLTQKTDTDFDEYRVDADDLQAMRARFADWRDQLTARST
jgi:Nucleotidyl transferase AbiEii toxin, Type IV TA system